MDNKARFELFLDKKLAAYKNISGISDLKEELLTHLMDKYNDLRENGATEELAYLDSVEDFKDLDDMIEDLLPEAEKFKSEEPPAPSPDTSRVSSFNTSSGKGKEHKEKLMDWDAEFTGDPTHRSDFKPEEPRAHSGQVPPPEQRQPQVNDQNAMNFWGPFGFSGGFAFGGHQGQSWQNRGQAPQQTPHGQSGQQGQFGFTQGNRGQQGFTLGSALSELAKNITEELGLGAGGPRQTLFGKSMRNTTFRDADLSSHSITMCDMGLCNFENVKMTDSRVRGSEMRKSNFVNVDFSGTRFTGVSMKRVYMDDVNFSNVSFTGSDMKYSTFKSSKIINTRVNGSDWSRSVFQNVTMQGAFIMNCDLKRSTFEHSDLINVVFQNCDVKGAQFSYCTMNQETYGYLNQYGARLENIKVV